MVISKPIITGELVANPVNSDAKKNDGIANQHGIFPMQYRSRIIHDGNTYRTYGHRDADILMMEIGADDGGEGQTHSNPDSFAEVITVYKTPVC